MKLKRILSCITAASVTSSCLLSSATAFAQEDVSISEEYKSSPYYTKLVSALEDSADKSTMEKALAVALSQEGYKNYSTQGIDIEQARADGLLWTGVELRMNSNQTGNTEYTRWAQQYVMNRDGDSIYIDCDWCAIFVSWCLYQAGYYSDEVLRKYYYSYCAEPRVSYDADSWILAYDLDQKNVWYTPKAHHKLDAYNWSTYYHVDVDPYDLPYKPGGVVFFSWDGSGEYFDHVAIVVDYDKESHVLTYTNGNSDGQVITRQINLDREESFRGQAFTKNSNRVMAYGEYDEIRPHEQRDIHTEYTDLMWDKGGSSGLLVKTDSDSKIVSVSVDGEYIGSNIENNMILLEGKLAIGKSELTSLPVGQHTLQLAFDDGVVQLALHVTDEGTLTEKRYGDANLDGEITVADATLIQKAAVGLLLFPDLPTAMADVNGDGKVSILDVTCIQKYAARYAQDTGRTGELFAG
ncbi:MAG: dockerin type I domain-containing protein [Ruminococcus sp.]